MWTKEVMRYYADGCNRGFWSKQGALNHEVVCKCWKNPKHKTCLTCTYSKMNDYESSEGHYNGEEIFSSRKVRECHNENFDYEKDFTPAHKNAPDVGINCTGWKLK